MRERFISHRRTSVYDTTVSNHRLIDAYYIFYYFLTKDDKLLYTSHSVQENAA